MLCESVYFCVWCLQMSDQFLYELLYYNKIREMSYEGAFRKYHYLNESINTLT